MANEVRVVINADDRASAKLDKISQSMGKTMRRGGLLATAALAATGAAALKLGGSFETAFAEVSTLIDIPNDALESLRENVLGLSKEMGIDATESTKALYQAISAGVAPGNVIDFLSQSTRLAVGGVTDLTTAVDLNTTIMNAWKLESAELGRVQDMIFTTVRLGKTTVGELGQAFFNVAPAAAAANISIEQIGAAMATLTASGTRTAEATTQLRQLILSLTAPTKRTGAVMEELGIKFSQAEISALGLDEVLRRVTEATGGNLEVMRRALGSVEAVNAALVLGGKGQEHFIAGLAAMEVNAGAADEAFEKMNATFERQVAMLTSEVKGALVELGLKILPTVTEKAQELIEYIRENAPTVKEEFAEWAPLLKDIGVAFLTTAGAAQDFVGAILDNEAALITAIAAIGTAMAFLMPGGALILGLGVLVLAFGAVEGSLDDLDVASLETRQKLLQMTDTMLKVVEVAGALGVVIGLVTGQAGFAAMAGGAAITAAILREDLNKELAEVNSLLGNQSTAALAAAESAMKSFDAAMLAGTATVKDHAAAVYGLGVREGAVAAQTLAMVGAIQMETQVADAAERAVIDYANALGEVLKITPAAVAAQLALAAATLVVQTAFLQGAPASRLLEQLDVIKAIKAEIDAMVAAKAAIPDIPSAGDLLGGLGDSVDAAIEEVESAWERGAREWMEAIAKGVRDGSVTFQDAVDNIVLIGHDGFISLLNELASRESDLERIMQIVSATIERGFVRLQDIADLTTLGEFGGIVADDFINSFLGADWASISVAIFEHAEEEAREAAEEAAEAFTSAFEAAMGDISGMLSGFAGMLSGLVGEESTEQVEERLRLTQLQLNLLALEDEALAAQAARLGEIAEKEQLIAMIRGINEGIIEGMNDALAETASTLESYLEGANSKIEELETRMADKRRETMAIIAQEESRLADLQEEFADRRAAGTDRVAIAEQNLKDVRKSGTEAIREMESELQALRRDMEQSERAAGGGERSLTQIAADLAQARDVGNTARIEAFQRELQAATAAAEARAEILETGIAEEQAAIDAAQTRADEARAVMEAELAVLEAAIEELEDSISTRRDDLDAELALLQEEIDAREAARDARREELEKEIEDLEEARDARQRIMDENIAIIEDQITAIRDTTSAVEDEIAAIEDEIAALEIINERRMLERQLIADITLLQTDLLRTDADIIWAIHDQIEAYEDLMSTWDILNDDVLDARDAVVLLQLGLEDLAEMILEFLSGMSALPPGFGFGGSGQQLIAGSTQLALPAPDQTFYINTVVLQGDPAKSLAALGANLIGD